MPKDVYYGKTLRKSFARVEEVQDMPNLLEIQKKSYRWFLEEGLRDVFKDVASVTDYSGTLELSFVDYSMNENPKYSEQECKARDATYAAPLKVSVRLRNKETEEIKEQEIFMGDFPLMTESGTFIINGAERVIVSQIVRSPGVYFDEHADKTNAPLYGATTIPYHGAWLEYETDVNDIFYVRIDKNRKLPVTWLLRAMGKYDPARPYTWLTCVSDTEAGAVTDEDLLEVFGRDVRIVNTLERDTCHSRDESLIEIYRRLRPGDPPTVETSETMLDGLFFDRRRYDMSNVGRYKVNKKLAVWSRIVGRKLAAPIADLQTGEIVAEAGQSLNRDEAEALGDRGLLEAQVFDEHGEIVRVFGNGMVPMAPFVSFDPEELGVKENVRWLVLRQLLEQFGDDMDALTEYTYMNQDATTRVDLTLNGTITIDFKKFREVADEVGAVLMVDMAHIAGLVAAGLHENPCKYADVVTSTTHKTLRGPRGGIILTNDEEIIKKINKVVFPGIQGGPLMHVIAGKAECFYEALQPEFKKYQNWRLSKANSKRDKYLSL